MPPDPPRGRACFACSECALRTVQVPLTFHTLLHHCVRSTPVIAEQIAFWSDNVQLDIK